VRTDIGHGGLSGKPNAFVSYAAKTDHHLAGVNGIVPGAGVAQHEVTLAGGEYAHPPINGTNTSSCRS